MAKTYFFIGIGGVSTSALAVYLMLKGEKVYGSDIEQGCYVKMLENFGIKCHIGHKQKHITRNIDYIVTNCAIKEDNPELIRAKQLLIPVITRAELLGLISKDYKNVIAISGSHGKTTTTAMLAEIFAAAGLKPTIHIGGQMILNGSNFLVGEKQFFITEACEYKNSFHQLKPSTSVILNVEADHLDFFKNLENVQKSFEKFEKNSKNCLIFNKIEENFYFSDKLGNTFQAKNISKTSEGFVFDYYENNKKITKIFLKSFCQHNVVNAIAAISISRLHNVPLNAIKDALKNFKGVKRRFEVLGKIGKTVIVHDYAHHPTEIEKTIAQAKSFGKVLVVFQPHTYTRTKMLLPQFLSCFNKADKLFLVKTYAARESEKEGISAKQLYNLIKKQQKCSYFENFNDLKTKILKGLNSKDCVLILGAGNINELAESLIN